MMLNYTPEEINRYFPIEAIVIYPGGMKIQRGCNLPLSFTRNYLRQRGAILRVTRRSLNRLALLVKSSGVTFLSVMTLTYGGNYPMSGRAAKAHLNKFLIYASRTFGKFEYIWCLEFQERGAVHFHIATTLLPPDGFQRATFADIWQKVSTPMSWEYCALDYGQKNFVKGAVMLTDENCLLVHCFPRHWGPVLKRDGMGRYFAKYSAKIRQKSVPIWYSDVGRFWGASRGVKLPEGEFFAASGKQAADVAKELGREVGHWEILPKIILF